MAATEIWQTAGSNSTQPLWDDIRDVFNTGDQELKQWFMVKSDFWPVFLCTMYFILAKTILPSLTREMKPLEIRKLMVAYDLMIVCIYTVSVVFLLYFMSKTPARGLCGNMSMRHDRYGTEYGIAVCVWVLYLVKYVEFLDTLFFILRKKENLLTNLHIIHHTLLPLIYWTLMRTERSGFQLFPTVANSVVHIIMYSYYALAALGPNMRKYLWWKRYLTLLQLTHFVQVLIFVFFVKPFTGCILGNMSIAVDVLGAALFFGLFFNFYQNTFNKAADKKIK